MNTEKQTNDMGIPYVKPSITIEKTTWKDYAIIIAKGLTFGFFGTMSLFGCFVTYLLIYAKIKGGI